MPAQRCGNQIQVIGQNLGRNHTNSGVLEQLADGRAGEVNLFPPRAAVANRQHNGGNRDRKGRRHGS
jgi:hypothetical protein